MLSLHEVAAVASVVVVDIPVIVGADGSVEESVSAGTGTGIGVGDD